MTSPTNDRTSQPMPSGPMALWGLMVAALTGGVCWYYTQNVQACLAAAAIPLVVLFLSWRDLWRKAQKSLFIELQLFLLRCKVLPEEHKVIRNIPFGDIELKKRELMDMASGRFHESEKKLTETRHVLDKFVGTKASQFATQKGTKAVWEGEMIRAIVLFSDVRGFTSMTEKLKTHETVRYLNRMFTELEEVIAFSGGEINKYIGDALMAYFPFPVESAEISAKKAILAALRMQDCFHQVEATFKQNYTESVQTGLGVGMSSGDVIIGNLGSARRMEFTLIGDTVNMASRLCALAEDGQILINQDLAGVAGEMFRMEALDPVKLKGKSGLHRPYSVTGERIQQGLA